jgi:hypothetical protein
MHLLEEMATLTMASNKAIEESKRFQEKAKESSHLVDCLPAASDAILPCCQDIEAHQHTKTPRRDYLAAG